MSATEEEIWRQCEPLGRAWETLCDHGFPQVDRAADLRRLYRVTDTKSIEETEDQLSRAEHMEASLKYEFLHRILHEDFEAYARDITSGLNASAFKVPSSAFDPSLEEFEVDWDRSSMRTMGYHLIEVRVRPNPHKLDDTPRPKGKGGRPRKRDVLELACQIAMQRNSAFCGLQTKQALPIIEAILKTTLKTSKGFEGGVNEETLRRAKNAVCGKN
jgi:hypothetical protein